jgi:hypothetical protein
MSGRLWVGDPAVLPAGRWTFSNPYIWVVPGDDPLGTPGQAHTGQNNYVWALVANEDREHDADAAFVDFYFESFSTALSRFAITLIGSSRVDLPRITKDNVLCVIPFRPAAAGHGCLICVVRSVVDQLPPNWDVGLRGEWLSQVGQRNIGVIGGAPASPKVTPFEVSATWADATRVSVEITSPEMTEAEITQILWSSGLPPALARTEGVARVGTLANAGSGGGMVANPKSRFGHSAG